MAVLTEQERVDIWRDLMKTWSRRREPIAVSKADLRAAADALDNYLNDNAAAINSAIPVAARTGLTTAQKAELLSFVALKRYVGGA